MITAAHVVLWSDDAEATRGFLRDVLELDSVDAGGGWLICALPPAEVAVHPTEGEGPRRHELYLMCDDLEATLADLTARGVEIADQSRDEGWGVAAAIDVPGAGPVGLYQPSHPTPLDV